MTSSHSKAVFNTIAVFSLDGETGAATRVATTGSGGNMPWCHSFCDGDDRLLVVRRKTLPTENLLEASDGLLRCPLEGGWGSGSG